MANDANGNARRRAWRSRKNDRNNWLRGDPPLAVLGSFRSRRRDRLFNLTHVLQQGFTDGPANLTQSHDMEGLTSVAEKT
jgi:hypothetical protein